MILSELAGNVLLGTLIFRQIEYTFGRAYLYKFAIQHECGAVRYADSLLKVMRDQNYGETAFELYYELFDALGRYRVKCRARLVQ